MVDLLKCSKVVVNSSEMVNCDLGSNFEGSIATRYRLQASVGASAGRV